MSQIAPAEQMRKSSAARQVAPMEGQQAVPPGAAGQSRATGVLVIEDEKLMRRSLEQGLTKRGFVVWAAADGGEGVELHRGFGELIDVVLSDMKMPVMDGPQTLDALRDINPAVRFCFMTGDARPSTLRRLLNLGGLRVFTKPFPSVAEVAEELRELATCPVGIPARPELSLSGEEAVRFRDVAESETEKSLANGLFGRVFSSLARSFAGFGSRAGGRGTPSPGEPPV